MSENKPSTVPSVHGIVRQPWEFACRWYDVESIHKNLTRIRDPATGEKNNIPRDIDSMEFAEWLTDQYRLAMQKGAVLAIREMQGRVDAIDREEREGWCGHCACQSRYDSKRESDHW